VSGLQGSALSSLPAASSGEADAALGAPLYLEHCSPCHGLQGQGVDAPPLRNSQFVQTGGSQALYDTIADGRPGTEMPAWLQSNGGALTDLGITSVISYLHTLQGVASLTPVTPPPEEPTVTPLPASVPTPEPARRSEPGGPGAAVSLTGVADSGRPLFGLYCAYCHGPEECNAFPIRDQMTAACRSSTPSIPPSPMPIRRSLARTSSSLLSTVRYLKALDRC
jgi:mono/diheme cytochrome c family protein